MNSGGTSADEAYAYYYSNFNPMWLWYMCFTLWNQWIRSADTTKWTRFLRPSLANWAINYAENLYFTTANHEIETRGDEYRFTTTHTHTHTQYPWRVACSSVEKSNSQRQQRRWFHPTDENCRLHFIHAAQSTHWPTIFINYYYVSKVTWFMFSFVVWYLRTNAFRSYVHCHSQWLPPIRQLFAEKALLLLSSTISKHPSMALFPHFRLFRIASYSFPQSPTPFRPGAHTS